MSERDHSKPDRESANDSQREPQGVEPSSSASQPRSRKSTFDYEYQPEELPSWVAQQPRSSAREQPERSTSGTPGAPPPRPTSTTSRREPIPQLGDAFRRPNRSSSVDPDDRSPASTRDPYDRLRRVASKPQRPIEGDEDENYGTAYPGGYDDELVEAPPSRARRRASAPAPTRSNRQPATQQIGGMIAAAAPQTRFVAAIAGVSLVSFVL